MIVGLRFSVFHRMWANWAIFMHSLMAVLTRTESFRRETPRYAYESNEV